MTPFRRTLAMGLRIVAGGLLVALAARYGAVSRSPWTIAYATAALSIAMALTKRRYWSPPFEPDRFWLAKRLVGTVVSEAVLAAILFFLAYGVVAAIGEAQPFAPLHQQDLDYAIGALVISLVMFGVVRLLEGGKDPVDVALEELEQTLGKLDHSPEEEGEESGEPGPRRPVSDIERVEDAGGAR